MRDSKENFKNNCRMQLQYLNEIDKDGLVLKGWLLTIDTIHAREWFEISKWVEGEELEGYKRLLNL